MLDYFFNQTTLDLQPSKYDFKIYLIIIMHLRLSITELKTFKTRHATQNVALLADRA